jgi:Uma2 family endonuclease
MSIGSEGRDRLEKWTIYQRLPSLQHYVLVARDRPHVEVFNRIEGEWSGLKVLDGLDATLTLDAIGVSIPLSAIYRRVFP